MKKTLFLLVCLCIAFTSSAQLNVYNSGAVTISTTNTPAYSAKLTVGGTDNIGSNEHLNLHSCLTKNDDLVNVSVNGIVQYNNSSSGTSIGVRGQGRGGGYGRCYGVLGNLHSYDYGAGIFGGVDCPQGVSVSGKYAGYFYGGVYVTSSVTAQSFVSQSDERLKENIEPLEDSKTGSTLDNVLKMNVVKYTYKDFIPKPTGEESDSIEKEMEVPQRHIGLLAQELRELYPDLVYEGQDGYLGVNYVELVPVLIRSIQELKAELDEVKGENEAFKTRSAAYDDDETTDVSDATAIPSAATLAQNTPNPFSERTTIRFTLPENAQNAFIYIFDMSGKMYKQIPVDSSMQSVTIEGYELNAGMYIYSLVIGGKEIQTRRMILSK